MKLTCTINITLEKDDSYSVHISGVFLGTYTNYADAEQEIHRYVMKYFNIG